MLYDVTIKAHKKDYYKLKLVVNSLRYLNPQPENVYIITDDGFLPKNTNYDDKLISILDDEVVPKIDKTKLKYRPGWSYVNLVSITQNFTKNNYYFDVQADNFFTKPLDLFENNKPKLFQPLNYNQSHEPYFKFNEHFFNIKKCNPNTYIIEFIMYSKFHLNKLFESYGSREDFIKKVYDDMDGTKYPADQEIFGNLICTYFSQDFIHVNDVLTLKTGCHYPEIIDEKIIQYNLEHISTHRPEVYALSVHTWT